MEAGSYRLGVEATSVNGNIKQQKVSVGHSALPKMLGTSSGQLARQRRVLRGARLYAPRRINRSLQVVLRPIQALQDAQCPLSCRHSIADDS